MSKVSETKTCGECKWFRQKGGREWGECFAPLPFLFNGHDEEHDTVFPDDPHDNDACPAFDDGSYDKAVEELVIAWIESSAIIRERCPYEWAFITKALAPFLEKAKEGKS